MFIIIFSIKLVEIFTSITMNYVQGVTKGIAFLASLDRTCETDNIYHIKQFNIA